MWFVTGGELGKALEGVLGEIGESVAKGTPRAAKPSGQRGQSNFELAANFGYRFTRSADPRESLRKRRILKLALTAHKVLSAQGLLPAAVRAKGRRVGFRTRGNGRTVVDEGDEQAPAAVFLIVEDEG